MRPARPRCGAAARAALAPPEARGPPITALRRDAGRPRPLLRGSPPSGQLQSARPHLGARRGGGEAPAAFAQAGAALLAACSPALGSGPRVCGWASTPLRQGWRRVTTSLPSPRSSRFLRSGKSAGLGGVGRRPPTLIFAAKVAVTATVTASVLPWPSHSPLTAGPRPAPGRSAKGRTQSSGVAGTGRLPRTGHLARPRCPSRKT